MSKEDKTLWCPGCRKIVTIGQDCGSQRCPEWEEIPEELDRKSTRLNSSH